MENQIQFTLMHGKFNVEDARSILLNFYNSKINYHNLQLFRAYEGGPGNSAEIEQKVLELKKVSQAITALLSEPDFANQTLEIEGHITIKMQ